MADDVVLEEADVLVLAVEVLAALADVDEVLEELVALQLHLDDVALLLLRELEQVHHDEVRLVVLQVDALGAVHTHTDALAPRYLGQ